MDFLKLIYNKIVVSVVLVVAVMISACQDDIAITPDGPAGEPAVISLRINLPDMKILSRSLTDEQDSQVNDVWIGIYDVNSGKQKYSKIFDTNYSGSHIESEDLTINTTSGNCYIVAVANAINNYGIKVNDSSSKRALLADLLKNAKTWDDFKNIAAITGSPEQIEYTEPNLVMSGMYSPGDSPEASEPKSWTEVTPVYIQPSTEATPIKMPGYIHLRRLVSHITFNLKKAEKITSFRPTRWKVVNNPRICYLQEQNENAADKSTSPLLSDTEPNANYGISDEVTEIQQQTDGSYTFNFYQYENKHTGIIGENGNYSEREKEYKNEGTNTNTGVYQSLCPKADSPNILTGQNANNFATFVEIEADVEYKANNVANPEEGGDELRNVTRTGKAKYTIHLGYVDNEVNDFNVNRNNKYIYNVTIKGLNDIVVEAINEGNPQENVPGAEGEVFDAIEKVYTVDAHYGVLNIKLSNSERSNLQYTIKAPYGGTENIILSEDEQQNRQERFYNWIKIKPTMGEKILAVYKTSESDEPWSLDDLRDVENHPHPSSVGNNDNASLWYTVFIDEYTYDPITGEDLTNWKKYVNQEMRSVTFRIGNYKVSSDGESIYSIGKYQINQRSIQTYYDVEGTGTALGIEHVNESYGKNLDWRWTANSDEHLSNSNGRWNVWKYLNNNNSTTDNVSTNINVAGRPWQCTADVSGANADNIQYGVLRYCDEKGYFTTQSASYMEPDPEGYPVPALAYNSSSVGTRDQDPQDNSKYYEAVSACMNRNRDLDGDGKIDANELRWYLPAEGKYERIMLGRNSLVTPLFSVSAGAYYCNSNDPIAQANKNWGWDGTISTNGQSNQTQYITSDHMKFYPEEGGSYHRKINIWWEDDGIERDTRYPWNIRCIRNLGVNLSTVTVEAGSDPVEKAYQYSEQTRTFDMTRYWGNSLRDNIATYLPMHTVADLDKNKVAKQFKVSANVSSYTLGTPAGDGNSYSTIDAAMNANVPCKFYKEDGDVIWRAPNQRELMMMLNEGLYTTTGNTSRISCTKEGPKYGAGNRYVAATPNGGKWQMNLLNAGQIVKSENKWTFYVRCIRDVAQEGRK